MKSFAETRLSAILVFGSAVIYYFLILSKIENFCLAWSLAPIYLILAGLFYFSSRKIERKSLRRLYNIIVACLIVESCYLMSALPPLFIYIENHPILSGRVLIFLLILLFIIVPCHIYLAMKSFIESRD